MAVKTTKTTTADGEVFEEIAGYGPTKEKRNHLKI